MNRNKRVLIIITLSALIVAALVFFSTQKPSRKQTSVPKTWVSSPQQDISFPTINKGTIFTLSVKNFPQASSLPSYVISEISSERDLYNAAMTISNTLGVSASPSSFLKKNNFVFTRNTKDIYFSLSRTLGIVTSFSYDLVRSSLKNKTPISTDPIYQQIRLLQRFFPPDYAYQISQTDRVPEGGAFLDDSPPQLFPFSGEILLGGYKVLTKEYSPSWIYCVIDDSGTIRTFIASLPPKLLSSKSQGGGVISIEDAVLNLNNGRGVLVGVAENGKEYDVSQAFSQGIISEASYVYVHKNGMLVPAYFFAGKGVTTNKTQQSFTAVVLATAESNN